MIVLDIETSGISPQKHGMLSLGAVDEKTGETFYGECYLPSWKKCDPRALEINGFTEPEIRDTSKKSDLALFREFREWVKGRSNILGGHNVGHFDILFLEEINNRYDEGKFPFSYRTVDLHSLAWLYFGESLTHEQICARLGYSTEPKPHNALQGALSELKAINQIRLNVHAGPQG